MVRVLSAGGGRVVAQALDDEAREEQQDPLGAPGVVDRDLDRALAPTLGVDGRELGAAVDERVALSPGARGLDGKLAPSPAQGPAAARAPRDELPDQGARGVVGLDDRPPHAPARELPAAS